MPRESKASKQERAIEVCTRIAQLYPDARPALNYEGDVFHLIIAVSLSAQTTDAAVNKVTPLLWEAYPTIADLAYASHDEVAQILRPIGFYNSKASRCISCARIIHETYHDNPPRTMQELQKLPGVGRKTANIVMNEGYGIVEGIAVDTHVYRIAHKLRFSKADDPSQVEQDLLRIIPKELWGPVNHQWILFGRNICTARKPHCNTCPLNDICPSAALT